LQDISEFCLTWRLVAIPIPIVLFTVAGISSDLHFRKQATALPQHKGGTLAAVKRPIGIAIIALVSGAGGILFVLIRAFLFGMQSGFQGISIVAVLVGIGLSVALLMLKNWGRWIVIVLYGLSLIRVMASLVLAHRLPNVLLELVLASYLAWVVWYLFQPHVRAAFLKIRLD
jgi:hypothetical protein